jgi:NADH-quinone oxidoreductase subunit M
MFAMLSSIGLPGLNGFVGEFLIMLGSYVQSWQAVAFAVTGVILGALYMMWTYERVMFGPITHKVNETIRDLSSREIATMVPLMALMVVMGLFPRFIISRIEPSITEVIARVHTAQARIDEEHRVAVRFPFPKGKGPGVRSAQQIASLRTPYERLLSSLGDSAASLGITEKEMAKGQGVGSAR